MKLIIKDAYFTKSEVADEYRKRKKTKKRRNNKSQLSRRSVRLNKKKG